MIINLDKDTILWIAGTVIAVITALGVFVGPIIAQKRQERIRKTEEKLRTHFEDLKREVIDHITQMTRNLTISKDRLVYGSYSNILPKYGFEQGEYFICFKVHFPEEAQKWEQLNKEAQSYAQKYEPLKDISARFSELKKLQLHQRPENWANEHEKYEREYKEMYNALGNDTTDLINNCRSFALSLDNKLNNISKYEIGKEFKRHKDCPICKRF